ncbi:hypothetical protein GO730_06865 [Spirosoma sp. HMF3257]|uniref:Lipoprotein n=1 Tax=Spirosoma telluris TaxID=2183553 RepID=A0A327NH21_9BACT|nr:hypothetical protein [Spirosoma telluris]RAI74125.1 hypothetical protein HMF3257_06795 [Spirosoma telluris]
MKKGFYWSVVGLILLSSCHPSIEVSTAYNVAGIYQLTGYTTSTTGDDNPDGTMNATLIDEQHINLIVKGTSGKVKINYSYANVLVVRANQTTVGQDTYNLLYKGRQIGIAGNDAISRYVELYPSATITIKGVEF